MALRVLGVLSNGTHRLFLGIEGTLARIKVQLHNVKFYAAFACFALNFALIRIIIFGRTLAKQVIITRRKIMCIRHNNKPKFYFIGSVQIIVLS